VAPAPAEPVGTVCAAHAAAEATAVMAPMPAGLLDLARGLNRRVQLAQDAGVGGSGLGGAHGNETGKGAGDDGQGNSSIHLKFLLIGASGACWWKPKGHGSTSA